MKTKKRRLSPAGQKAILREVFSRMQIFFAILLVPLVGFIFATALVVRLWFPAYACLVALCYGGTLTTILFKNTFGTFRESSFTSLGWFGVIAFIFLIVLGYLGCFTICYETLGLQTATGKPIEDTIGAFYFAVTTWVTIGLGDVIPTSASRLVVMLEAMVSYFTTGIALGLAVHVTSKIYDPAYEDEE